MLLDRSAAACAGHALMRMPVFTWTMVVTCLMVVFGFPALLLALGLLWAQRHFGGVLVGGAGAVDYQALFWFYGHPVVYVMFFPFVGMVGEILDLLIPSVLRVFSVRSGAARVRRLVDDGVGAPHVHLRGAVEQVFRADLDRPDRPRRH